MLQNLLQRIKTKDRKHRQNTVHVETDLKKTVTTLKDIYTYPNNKDVILRNLHIKEIGKNAVLLYLSTITDTNTIEKHIIEPLIRDQNYEFKMEEIVSAKSITLNNNISDITNEVNNGSAALFIDGERDAYLFDVSKFESRNVEKPENETVARGPKEAFTENSFSNLSLIRKRIKNENLVIETKTISKRSKNVVNILYIKNLTNDKLLSNVRNRLEQLDVDAVQNLSLLEQYIEERKYSLFPSILNTERPDRAASFIEDGHIVLIMDNSPDSLVLPATFWSFFHTAEDHYLRLLYGNFTRLLRLFALFTTLFTSAIYVSMVTFHVEMIPPDLLLPIASTREKVPFPAVIEVLLMEIAFELIREAGLRVPSPIGPTIGIVGALILGQAAVEASIVSPIVVIVVALSGLSSFAIGDVSLNFTIRLSRFLFLVTAGLFGLYGIAGLLTMGIFYLVSLKSFGVPYLAPYTPSYQSSKDTVVRRLLRNEKYRPGYLKPKDLVKK